MEIGIYIDTPIISTFPTYTGTLIVDNLPKRGFRYRFILDNNWITSNYKVTLFPTITERETYFSSLSIPFIEDVLPDRWGRTLIERKKNRDNRKNGKIASPCTEVDYLTGIDDRTRKGALRFSVDGIFVSADNLQIPPLARLGDYEEMLSDYEENGVKSMLLDAFFSSSSSLGGARPKINVIDEEDNLWIAKVPSKQDEVDVGGWEEVAVRLARKAGIIYPETMAIKSRNGFHTFLSKRFDRMKEKRIHMVSSALFIGKASNDSSFIDVASVISQYSSDPKADIKELYRRLVFSALINNTDNHLHNHSFILTENGWRLSPAYDMNPSIHGRESALMVDEGIRELSLSVIKETYPYYDLEEREADAIIDETMEAVSHWKEEAKNLDLADEIPLMEGAFQIN